MGKKDLTPQQDRCIAAYLENGGNQAAAFATAYPHALKWTKKTLYSKASTFFASEKVRERLSQLREVIVERAVVRDTDLLRKMAAIALADMRQIHDTDGQLLPMMLWPSREAAAIKKVSYSQRVVRDRRGKPTAEYETFISGIEFQNQISAGDKLFRHLGLYTQEREKGGLEPGIWDSVPPPVRQMIVEKLLAIAASAKTATDDDDAIPGSVLD